MAKFQGEKMSNTQKWRSVKTETGQMNFSTPQEIREGKNIFTSHKSMADSLNRQYLSRIRELVNKMGPQHHDPLPDYKSSVGPTSTFTFKEISMDQFEKGDLKE